MKLTYGRLIDDHERIQRLADNLLTELRCPAPSTSEVAHQLSALQFLVREHLEAESALLAECVELRLARSWADLMRDGETGFLTLKADWTRFLSDWNEELIAADIEGFRQDAEDVLSRLSERVAAETRALYATGLQMGAIKLTG